MTIPGLNLVSRIRRGYSEDRVRSLKNKGVFDVVNRVLPPFPSFQHSSTISWIIVAVENRTSRWHRGFAETPLTKCVRAQKKKGEKPPPARLIAGTFNEIDLAAEEKGKRGVGHSPEVAVDSRKEERENTGASSLASPNFTVDVAHTSREIYGSSDFNYLRRSRLDHVAGRSCAPSSGEKLKKKKRERKARTKLNAPRRKVELS